MRLHRHDELAKEVQKAIYRCGGVGLVSSERYAAAALDALLEAAVRLKVGRPAISSATKDTWYAETCFPGSKATDGDFPALILRMEASDDKV